MVIFGLPNLSLLTKVLTTGWATLRMNAREMDKSCLRITHQQSHPQKEERRSFAFLTIVMAPVLSGLLIAAYGFLVWFYQMLFSGPPHA